MNLSQIINVATAVAGLLPAAAAMVQGVEAALPAGTAGAVKLDVVKTGLQSAYTAAGQVAVEFEQLWPHLSAIISAIVTALNTIGVFKKSAPAA